MYGEFQLIRIYDNEVGYGEGFSNYFVRGEIG